MEREMGPGSQMNGVRSSGSHQLMTEGSKRLKTHGMEKRRFTLSTLFVVSLVVLVSLLMWKGEFVSMEGLGRRSEKEESVLRSVLKVEELMGLDFGNMEGSNRRERSPEEEQALKRAMMELGENVRKVGKQELVRALLGVEGPGVVVDVGASTGKILTFPALDAKRVVYAVEPDERNVRSLLIEAESKRLFNRMLKVIRDAAGIKERYMYMQFNRQDPTLSCVHCMDGEDPDVAYAQVEMLPVDRFVMQPVHIFNTYTRGYEGDVLYGAAKVFDDLGVHFVILNLDPLLLSKHGNFENLDETIFYDYNRPEIVMDFLLDRKYKCFDFRWSKPESRLDLPLGPITKEIAATLTQSLMKSGTSVDLFCMKSVV